MGSLSPRLVTLLLWTMLISINNNKILLDIKIHKTKKEINPTNKTATRTRRRRRRRKRRRRERECMIKREEEKTLKPMRKRKYGKPVAARDLRVPEHELRPHFLLIGCRIDIAVSRKLITCQQRLLSLIVLLCRVPDPGQSAPGRSAPARYAPARSIRKKKLFFIISIFDFICKLVLNFAYFFCVVVY